MQILIKNAKKRVSLDSAASSNTFDLQSKRGLLISLCGVRLLLYVLYILIAVRVFRGLVHKIIDLIAKIFARVASFELGMGIDGVAHIERHARTAAECE